MVKQQATAVCPSCGADVELGRKPQIGDLVVCPECEAELEVISVNPLELDWAYDEPDEAVWQEDEEQW